MDVTPRLLSAVETRARRAKAIFNYAPGKPDDHRRAQARFRPHETNSLARLKSQVLRHVPATHTADRPDSWVVLVSQPGCQDQMPHRDYDPAELGRIAPGLMPWAVVVAVHDGTKLHVWCNGTDAYRLVTLDAGDLVLFRGDVVHAGAGYADRNVRIHAYLDSEHHIRPANRTYVTSHQIPAAQ